MAKRNDDNLNPNELFQETIREHPETFFENTLGVHLWEKQMEIVESIRDHKRTTVRSCNAAGKTKTLGDAVLWFLFAYAPCIVITTAPTYRQVKNQLWKNIKHSHSHALVELGGFMKQTELEFSADWFAIGVATKDGESGMETMQGWHAKNILFVVDEASGVGKPVFEAIEGGLLGGGVARLVMIGNPTRNTGEFADSFKSPLYHKIHISAFDTPNVKANDIVIQGLVTQEWIDDIAKKYGEDSDVYRVRVLGEFPKHEDNTAISLGVIEDAIDSDRERYGEEEVIGLDVSRYGGDRTAFVYRKGNYAKVLEIIERSDLMHIAGRAIYWLKNFPSATMRVDIIGIGAGVFDRLREQPTVSDRVEGVNVAVAAEDKEHFANKRAEGWFSVRDWLKDAVLDNHPDWYQLAAPKYKLNSRGQTQLESKDEMKKRGVSSPDIGDALMLTLTQPTEGTFLAPVWI